MIRVIFRNQVAQKGISLTVPLEMLTCEKPVLITGKSQAIFRTVVYQALGEIGCMSCGLDCSSYLNLLIVQQDVCQLKRMVWAQGYRYMFVCRCWSPQDIVVLVFTDVSPRLTAHLTLKMTIRLRGSKRQSTATKTSSPLQGYPTLMTNIFKYTHMKVKCCKS